ncbi:hydroxymethylbilane synthase [Corynebacterium rouxii]|uniref:Porphobilinogen deaminase n=1 Tax=Corynebacterium rouxii TaxID=2719119 RepID=A0A6I8MGF3_9CORY|nr:hydroxymethylbilane synthase [Corynebacterium rouxii]MDT9408089.1 hydroxymethylbilane synthase [Corynebacterium rouxii]MDT9410270.1 hydroxymethylbilane synthase [Corynebacterium rouxii]VZH84377.1 hydroxymethylbilane synthase [Corynebacterium rouxii]
MTLKIGTRGSLLATTQSGHVRDDLLPYEAELVIVTTHGDVNMAPVERIGVGVFTQALREELYTGGCDIAVHSFKDLPTELDPRFHLVVPKRADFRDCLIARDGLTLADLPAGALIGTGAPRRISQIKALRPDVECVPLRGNIDTRMGKVTSGELDAVVLAYAGLTRVGRGDEATQVFDPQDFLPAPAQGALAVECRADDAYAREAIDSICDEHAQACAVAERVVLNRLEAGCTAPVAAHATLVDGTLTLTAAVIALDGSKVIRRELSGPVADSVALAEELTRALIADGAATILG